MNLNLVSLSTVKTHLGISNNPVYDAQLSAMIPVVSSDVRRILNNRYDTYISSAFTSGSTQILVNYGMIYNLTISQTPPLLELGQVVYHTNIPDDTYLLSYNPDTGYYTMSAAATGDGSYIYPSISIAMFPTISKMIWYKFSKQNTTNSISQGIQSESYGPVSITYSANEINKQYDYPQSLIDDLGKPYAGVR